MKGITTRPDVKPERWYTTMESVKALEMSRTTFWRMAKDFYFNRRMRKGSKEILYQGKELIKFWKEYLMPV